MNQQAQYRQSEWDAAAQDDKERKAIAKSGRTAISRKALSVPVRWLEKRGMIRSTIYDYGCGRGDDLRHLREKGYFAGGHDPNHKPIEKESVDICLQVSDTVLCTYVLNVVQKHRGQDDILRQIKENLKDDAVAYITVRRDIKTEGINKRGTYQRNVLLNLPVVRETSTYCIYKMEK